MSVETTIVALSGKANKASLPINVKDKDYGAVGDDTANDTAAILAATAAAKAVGGPRRVYAPKGIYLVDPSALAGLEHDMELFGDGRWTTIFKARSAGTLLEITGRRPERLNLHDFGMDGNGIGTNGIHCHDMGEARGEFGTMGDAWGVTFARLTLKNFTKHGIALGNTVDPTSANTLNQDVWSSSFDDLELHDCGDHPIYVHACAPTCRFDNVLVIHPPAVGSVYSEGDGAGYGIFILTGSPHIRNYNAGDNGAAAGTGGGGLFLGQSVNGVVQNVNLEQLDGKYVYDRSISCTFDQLKCHIERNNGNQHIGLYLNKGTTDLTVLINPRFTYGGTGATWKNGYAIHSVGLPILKVDAGQRGDNVDTQSADRWWSVGDAQAYPILRLIHAYNSIELKNWTGTTRFPFVTIDASNNLIIGSSTTILDLYIDSGRATVFRTAAGVEVGRVKQTGYFDSPNGYGVLDVKVVGAQGALVADTATAGSATAAACATTINLILARLRAHGLIAT